MLTEHDITSRDGRTIHVHDDGDVGDDRITLFWHHGTPNVGEPPAPLMDAARDRGIRWIGHDRPGYGGSTRAPGRSIASVAADVVDVADAVGIGRFAVLGHSGGGPHALACASLSPERVVAAVSISGLAPVTAPGLDWFAGMSPAGAAELRAAMTGAGALRALLESTEFDPEQFTPADHGALAGEWGWFDAIVERALAGGLGGMLDDDVAQASPWGFDVGTIDVPVLVVHGDEDRIVPPAHGDWLAGAVPSAELWVRPGDGHLSVLRSGLDALDWIVRHA